MGGTGLPDPELEILCQISKVTLRVERTILLKVIILGAYLFPSWVSQPFVFMVSNFWLQTWEMKTKYKIKAEPMLVSPNSSRRFFKSVLKIARLALKSQDFVTLFQNYPVLSLWDTLQIKIFSKRHKRHSSEAISFPGTVKSRDWVIINYFCIIYAGLLECAISFTDKSPCLEKFPVCQPNPGNLKQREATGAAEQVNVNPWCCRTGALSRFFFHLFCNCTK